MNAGKMCGALALSALVATAGSVATAGPLADATSDSLWGIELGGYLDFSSTFNLNDPDSDSNGLRIFDQDSGDIVDFNAFQLYIDKSPEAAGDVGFRADMIFGEDADVIGGDDTGVFTSGDSFNLYQAYLSYIAPVGNGLTIDIGRFATWHGYELIESPANSHFSRAILFGYAIPFTHTGIRLSYDINDMWGLSGGITQGWDVTENDNDSYTFHGQIKWSPTEDLFIGNSFAYGAERDDPGPGQNSDYTFLWDLVVTYQINEMWSVGGNVDYAFEEMDGFGLDDAEWIGFAGYVQYDFRDDMYLAARGEWFDDEDGARTGTATEYWEVTLTYGYQITEQLLGRIEYRHDSADVDVFEGDNGVFDEDSQDTIALEVIYTF